jgi:hypothetical protein
MTDELPTTEPVEVQMGQVRRWLEGYVDKDNLRHPGLIEMVTELYEEAKKRRERREAFIRAIASGGILAVFGVGLTWLKDHIK